MIYVILTWLFYPLLSLITFLKRKRTFNNIVVIQTAKIGDMICSTAVFREIKKKYSGAHLTLIADPVSKGLLVDNPNINELITITTSDYRGFMGKLKLSRLIRRGEYDAAICLNPNMPYAIALLWGLVPVRASVMPDFSGTTFNLASGLFTHIERHIRGSQVSETYVRMLRAIGIKSSDITKEVYKSDGADTKVLRLLNGISKPVVGIAVSSGNRLKELGEEKVTRLVDELADNMDICVALIGSVQDNHAAEAIMKAVRSREKVIDTTGKLKLNELPALIERVSLFIGVDTGITYMADALSVPLINISGPADMADQKPLGNKCIIIQKEISCVPCSHAFKAPYNCERGDRACITSVTVQEISGAAKKLLGVT